MSQFWIFVNFCRYDRVLNMRASRCNYGRVLNVPGFRVYQVSVYGSVAQGCKYAWIWLKNALWQGSEYAWSRYYKHLNKPPVLNMLGLRTLQGCEYARVTQGAEYAWISLNIPQKCLDIHEYVLITLHIIEYVGI